MPYGSWAVHVAAFVIGAGFASTGSGARRRCSRARVRVDGQPEHGHDMHGQVIAA